MARLRSADVFDCSISSAAGSRTTFELSLLFHGVGTLLLVVVGAWSLEPVPSLVPLHLRRPVLLVAPPVEKAERALDPPVARAPAPVAASKPALYLPPRIAPVRPALKPAELAPSPLPIAPVPPLALVERSPSAPLKLPAETGGFPPAPGAAPSVAKPAEGIRPVNFAAAGLPEPARPGGRMLARVGAFEAAGDGTGAPRRASVVVASAGFSGPAGGAVPPTARAIGPVRSGGFGDATVEAPAPSRAGQNAAKLAASSVKILFEPSPVYTEEARRLRVEGEVLLELLFCASGEVRVLRVVKPLGHGLDEAAIEAARKIHFQPAQRAGQPVDSTAEARITFQLAY